MSWVRDVLTGAATLDPGPNDRHELDTVLSRWYWGDEWKERLTQGFRDLLTDPDRRLRAAAVFFFARTTAEDDGLLVESFQGQLPLYDGVRPGWYPGGADLRALLAGAIASRAGRSEDAQAVARSEALRPGAGQQVVSAVVRGDPEWVRTNLRPIVQASPEALGVVLFWLRTRGQDVGPWLADLREGLADDQLRSALAAMLSGPADVAAAEALKLIGEDPPLGGVLLIEMEAANLDLAAAVIELAARVPHSTLERWIQTAVSDPKRRSDLLDRL